MSPSASQPTAGYAIGALLAGITADAFGLDVAMWVIAALTFVSGVVSAARMRETLSPKTGGAEPACAETVAAHRQPAPRVSS
ncbi:MAG: hypothetical protein A3H97_01820 [Acidobacteria bacterium RIFCSPLOWO2_02_FULL_65_29]|nr:MAG: hypothetical protein A3H97_01820 [Acidobacteria bacterium RIFCSPLOWO2_02_FULL_65_29]